jgi:hypothetical protein
MHWFKNRIDAKILIEEYPRHFNEVRSHYSFGQLTPAEFKWKLSTTDPEKAHFRSIHWAVESRQVILSRVTASDTYLSTQNNKRRPGCAAL